MEKREVLRRFEAGRAELTGEGRVEELWPEPIAFDAPSCLPGFPLEVLPAKIAGFCSAVAKSRQVPADLPAVLALGVLSAAAARRFTVSVKSDYAEPVNLFVACALEPGERKSSTLRDLVAPLAEHEVWLQRKKAPAIAAAREQRKIEEARLEYLRREAAKKGTDLSAEARHIAENLTQVPTEPQLIVGDVTPEKLASVLAAQGGRVALADAESGGIFEILAGRYSGNRRPNLDAFLRGHAGDDLRVDRVDRSEIVRHPALTVVLAPQLTVLRRLAEEPDFRGRGLLARFLYALPSSLVGSRCFVESAVDSGVRAAYEDSVRSILQVEPPEEEESAGHVLCLSPGAFAIWRKFHDEVEGRQAEGRDLRAIRDWASKAPGAALRIAGLLHVAQGRREDASINDVTAAAAWAIVADYFLPHAREAFVMMGADPRVEQARKIAAWIAKTGRKRVSVRDAHKNFPAFGEPADFEVPFRMLEDRGIVRRLPGDHSGPGRKPSPSFEANPGLCKRSAESAELADKDDSVHSDDDSWGSET